MNSPINRLVDIGQQAVEASLSWRDLPRNLIDGRLLDPKRSHGEMPNYGTLDSLKKGGNGGPLDRVGEEMRASQFWVGSISK